MKRAIFTVAESGRTDFYAENLIIEFEPGNGAYCHNVNTGDPIELEWEEKEVISTIRDMMWDSDCTISEKDLENLWHAVEYIAEQRTEGASFEFFVRMSEDEKDAGLLNQNGLPEFGCKNPKAFDDIYSCLDYAIDVKQDLESRPWNEEFEFSFQIEARTL